MMNFSIESALKSHYYFNSYHTMSTQQLHSVKSEIIYKNYSPDIMKNANVFLRFTSTSHVF